jgi:hypothetical protein
MSFFGNSTQAAQTEKTPDLTAYNILPQNTSQASQDVLIPYFAGIQRIATQWIAPAMNVNTTEVKSSGGGGKGGGGGGGSGQFKYFADLASIVAMGPADTLYMIIVDNTRAFSGLVQNSGAEYVVVSMGQWGNMRLSWGNPNQNPPSAFSYAGQNPMGGQRGKIRAEFPQLYFGSVGKTSAPTIELVLERCPDVPGYAHGAPQIKLSSYGVNPIAVIYEIMTNGRYGLNIPASKFDITYIQGRINALAAASVWLSPIYTNQQPVRSVIQDICQYFDGFVRKVNGLIQIGYYTHASTTGSGAPQLNMDAFLPPGVKFKPVGYSGTINEVLMTQLNSTNYFIQNSVRAADSASRLLTGQPRNVQIDRPFLTAPSLAQAYVEEYLRFNSQPLVTGSGDVKKEAMYTINVGDLAQIEAGDFGAQVLCRITGKTIGADNTGKCGITFEQERGTYDSAYSQPPIYPADNNVYINPAQITKALIVQLPTGLRNKSAIEVAVLAQRQSPTDYGFVTWVSSDDLIFDSTNTASSFAVFATLISTARGNATAGVLDSTGFNISMVGIDKAVGVTHTQALANVTLIFIDKEIMSLETLTALGGNNYHVTAIRGVYGSLVAAHSSGSVWIQNRRAIVPIAWDVFALSSTFYFKLQAFTHFTVFDLSTASTFAFTVGKINASLIGPKNLTVGTDGVRVIFNWQLDPSPQVFGYEIRYGIQGSNWQQATIAIDGIRSAHTVSMIVPPGPWTFYVTSYDEFFNYSANIAQANFTVPSLFTLVEENYGNAQHVIDIGGQIDDAYGSTGSTFTNCFVHPTAYVLVPIDGAAATGNDFNLFDNFVVTPPALCTITTPVLDSLGSGTSIRSSISVYEYLWGFSGVAAAGLDLIVSLAPQWDNSTIVNGYIHPTAYCIVPTSSRLANYVPTSGTGFEMFDTFVLDPVIPTTVTFVQDIGLIGPLLATLTTAIEPGPEEAIPNSSATISCSNDNVTYTQLATGVGTISGTTLARYVKYQAQINDLVNVGIITGLTADTLVAPEIYWTSIEGQMRTSPDNITFGPWQQVQSNFVSDRYIQYMVSWNPYGGAWPVGVSSIWMLLDSPSSIQQGLAKTVAIGGTTFTFSPPFRTQLPPVQVTIVGSVALFPIVVSQSLTSFMVKVFSQAGTDVGGIINWRAEGV